MSGIVEGEDAEKITGSIPHEESTGSIPHDSDHNGHKHDDTWTVTLTPTSMTDSSTEENETENEIGEDKVVKQGEGRVHYQKGTV